jgi:hypothetical protein
MEDTCLCCVDSLIYMITEKIWREGGWLNLFWTGYKPVVGSCKQVNSEHSGSIKCWEYLECWAIFDISRRTKIHGVSYFIGSLVCCSRYDDFIPYSGNDTWYNFSSPFIFRTITILNIVHVHTSAMLKHINFNNDIEQQKSTIGNLF